MKLKYSYIVVIFALCLGVFADNSIEYADGAMGIRVRMFSNKKMLQSGSPMPIWIEIENKSDKTYYIKNHELDYFSLLDSQGLKVPYSLKGQKLLDPYSVAIGTSMRPLPHIELPPGKTKKIKAIDDLMDFIDIHKKGKYYFYATIRLLHDIYIDKKNARKNKIEAYILRLPPLEFNFLGNNKTTPRNTSRKYININPCPKSPIYGLIVKQLKISRKALDVEKSQYTAEIIVDIKNISSNDFPMVQWLGVFDMALWNCKVFHNGKLLKHELYDGLRYFAGFNQVKYHYWYDVIKPGETKSFKLFLDLQFFPEDIPKGAEYINPNGSWDFIFSRKIFLAKDEKYNTVSEQELSKTRKWLVLPKINIEVKNCPNVGIPPPPIRIDR